MGTTNNSLYVTLGHVVNIAECLIQSDNCFF